MVPGVRLIVFGRQGAGKGTQCIRLARHFVVPHISTGDILRAAIKSGTELGHKVESVIAGGNLVTDELMLEIVDDRLQKPDARNRGFILDGFPRTIPQAQGLMDLLQPRGLDRAIDLDVPEDIVLHRLSIRRVCRDCGANYSTKKRPHTNWTCDVCGGEVWQRPDDTEEAIRQRLDLYAAQTEPLTKWFADQGLLSVVDGVGITDEVTERLLKAIEDARR